jgi:hypothetical protein
MNRTVLCIVETVQDADGIVSRLTASGIASRNISVLYPNRQGDHDVGHENSTKAPEGAVLGAGTGGLLGGTLGLLAGIGALAIPGVGPFIAAGPIMAALGGLAVGGTLGGITGALAGLGVREMEAKVYDGKLRGGNILLAVHTEDSKQVDFVKDVFAQGSAHDIAVTSEASAPFHPTKAPTRRASPAVR